MVKDHKLFSSIHEHGLLNEYDPASIDDLQVHLSHMEKMAAIGQLSSSVAHEMRNLLGMIRTAIFNIERALPQKEQTVINNVEIINRSVGRAREFLDNLLNLSHVSYNNREFIDVCSLVDRLLMLFSKELEWRNIELNKNYHPLPLLKIDGNAFQECILNLVLNAIQSIDGSGTITISITPWKDGMSISVTDTGCGISIEHQEKIFDRFYTTKKNGQGTGLGLSIVKNIASNMGGDVSVKSRQGFGSTFILQFPYLEHAYEPFDLHNAKEKVSLDLH